MERHHLTLLTLFLKSDLSFSVLFRSTLFGSHLLLTTTAKTLLVLLVAFRLRSVEVVVPCRIVSRHLI
jgi:hypothetical protein